MEGCSIVLSLLLLLNVVGANAKKLPESDAGRGHALQKQRVAEVCREREESAASLRREREAHAPSLALSRQNGQRRST